MDGGLREHSVVLNLGLAHRGAVCRDDHQLGLQNPSHKVRCRVLSSHLFLSLSSYLATSESLEGRLVAKGVLAALHDERQTRGNALCRLLSLSVQQKEKKKKMMVIFSPLHCSIRLVSR